MIHPYFIVTHRLDHQVHFSHRGMTGSTLITNFPYFSTAMANALRRRCTVTPRPLMTRVPLSTTRVRPGAGRRFRPQGDTHVAL
jgi:hypothetical protein